MLIISSTPGHGQKEHAGTCLLLNTPHRCQRCRQAKPFSSYMGCVLRNQTMSVSALSTVQANAQDHMNERAQHK